MHRRVRASHLGALSVVAVLLLAPTTGGIDSRLTCPRTVAAGEVVPVDVRLENSFCTVVQVRMLSTLVWNANETTGAVSIVGPSIAERDVSLPAATDRLPGTCTGGFCDGSFLRCSSAADCECRDVTPGLRDVSIATPETIPVFPDGTAAMLSIASEVTGNGAADVAQCLIAVPEPTLRLQLVCAIGSVALWHRRRRRSGQRSLAPRADFEEVQP
jgi:hypothetical protein